MSRSRDGGFVVLSVPPACAITFCGMSAGWRTSHQAKSALRAMVNSAAKERDIAMVFQT